MLTAYIVYWNFIQEPILARGKNTPSIGCQSIAGDHAQCSGSLVLPIHQATRFLKENSWTHTYTHAHNNPSSELNLGTWSYEAAALHEETRRLLELDTFLVLIRSSLLAQNIFLFLFFSPLTSPTLRSPSICTDL